MKKIITSLALLTAVYGNSQQIVSSWMVNTTTTGKYYEVINGNPTGNILDTGEPANCQLVCSTTDSVYVKSTGLAELMGPYLNPGAPVNQDYTWRFPKNPQEETGTKYETQVTAAVGLLINGVPAYGNGNAASWNPATSSNSNTGQGIWNAEAWYNEGFVLDTAYGAHPQQAGAYHSHAVPKNLYDGVTGHSPLIGWSFDGFPIYGPYGYSTAMDNTSAVVRMETSYQLRNITVRQTLPDGTVLSPPNYGPNVSTTYPLGMYIEDYEYVSGLGDLDEYNGRLCVTPEFPAGIYAYFVTMDASGTPQYPYFIGNYYYGVVDEINVGMTGGHATIPSNCSAGLEDELNVSSFTVYPNPGAGNFTIETTGLTQGNADLSVFNGLGQKVFSGNLNANQFALDLNHLENGTYFITIQSDNILLTKKVIKQD